MNGFWASDIVKLDANIFVEIVPRKCLRNAILENVVSKWLNVVRTLKVFVLTKLDFTKSFND